MSDACCVVKMLNMGLERKSRSNGSPWEMLTCLWLGYKFGFTENGDNVNISYNLYAYKASMIAIHHCEFHLEIPAAKYEFCRAFKPTMYSGSCYHSSRIKIRFTQLLNNFYSDTFNFFII